MLGWYWRESLKLYKGAICDTVYGVRVKNKQLKKIKNNNKTFFSV